LNLLSIFSFLPKAQSLKPKASIKNIFITLFINYTNPISFRL
jgi:hypothetical protein